MSFQREYMIKITGDSSGAVLAIEMVEVPLEGIQNKAKTAGDEMSKFGDTSQRSFQKLMFGAQMGIFYLSMLLSAQDRVIASAYAIENAQENYTKAVKEHGPTSTEALRSARNLDLAQRRLSTANQLAALSYVGMTLQAISFGVQLSAEIAKTTTLIALKSTLLALSGPPGWAILAVAAGMAAGVGGAYVATGGFGANNQQNVVVQGSTLNVSSNVERALDDDNRQRKSDWRRANSR